MFNDYRRYTSVRFKIIINLRLKKIDNNECLMVTNGLHFRIYVSYILLCNICFITHKLLLKNVKNSIILVLNNPFSSDFKCKVCLSSI